MSKSLSCIPGIVAAVAIVSVHGTQALAATLTTANFKSITVTGASDVLNSGTLIQAISNGIDTGDPANPIVHGVAFTSSTITGGTQVNYTNGTYALQVPSVITALTTSSGFGGTLDDFMDALFTVGEGTMTIQGLTPGNRYRLQWFSYFNGQTGNSFQFRNQSGGAILSGPTFRDPASLTVLTFRADGPTQTFFVNGSSSALTLQGFALHDTTAVPEPSSLALLALGLFGFVARRSKT